MSRMFFVFNGFEVPAARPTNREIGFRKSRLSYRGRVILILYSHNITSL